MRLSLITRFLTSPVVLGSNKKGKKSDHVIVKCLSAVTGYEIHRIRPRLDEKLEFVCWDPLVQQKVLYKEGKKVRSVPAHPNGKGVEVYSINHERKTHREELWTHQYYPDDDGPGRVRYPRRQIHAERVK